MHHSACFCLALSAGMIAFGSLPNASAQEFGGIRGTFILEGDIPKLPPKPKENAAGPAAACGPRAIPDESIVVDPQTKGVVNVFIWIDDFDSENIPEEFAEPKEKRVEVTMKNCQFVPHAILARTGQTLILENEDPTEHRVHVSAIRGEHIRQSVPANAVFRRPITQPDMLPVPVTCDIHPWMRANLLVLEHPYAAVSDAKGMFEIKDIPPGTYEFRIYHEKAGLMRELSVDEVKIEAGETVDLGKLLVDVEGLK